MSLAEQRLTPEEYLDIERQATSKSEYYNGRMYAVSGTNEWHDTISTNTIRELGIQFKGRPCRIFSSDMRAKVSATGLYTYPDASALCGNPRYEDEKRDTLLNPTVIVEVLSTSTEKYDRGEKFAHYRRVDSIADYVLMAQDRVRVEHFARQPDGRWLLTELNSLDSMLHLVGVEAKLALADIYDKVEIETSGSELPGHP